MGEPICSRLDDQALPAVRYLGVQGPSDLQIAIKKQA